ncbi:MAG: hypothetical protein JST30_04370 [Armatimonadetes bacterium]|nr:hypothetical protein [Armatimonadota bacterium]
MSRVKEGDRVRVVSRPITEQDRTVYGYYEHMKGLTGIVENVYGKDEVAVKVDLDCLPKIPADLHKDATRRMRERFTESVGEEARKQLSKEELEFVPHYMLLVRAEDLEKA